MEFKVTHQKYCVKMRDDSTKPPPTTDMLPVKIKTRGDYNYGMKEELKNS